MNTSSDLLRAVTPCVACRNLWTEEARQAGWVMPPAKNQATMRHPLCPERHRPLEHRRDFGEEIASTTAHAFISQLTPPAGPLLKFRNVYDRGVGLWMSDVAVTVPAQDSGIRALVGGGASPYPDHALVLGWAEALERRSLFRRPRVRARLADMAEPLASADGRRIARWLIEGTRLTDRKRSWVAYDPASVTSIGVATHPDWAEASTRAALECVESAGLASWWRDETSQRCGPHSAQANKWITQSNLAAPTSTCSVWHTTYGPLHVVGALLVTQTRHGFGAILGSAAGPFLDEVLASALREVLHLHVTPILIENEGRAEFGRMYVGKAITHEYVESFEKTFPMADGCPRTDVRPHDSAGTDAEAYLDPDAVEVDCGDALTDMLRLTTVRVLCPNVDQFGVGTVASSGLKPDFLGV